MPLAPKRAAFVREYLIDLNASAAARRAGYSARTANRAGHELLSNPDIAAAVQEAQEERAQSTGVTAERVVNELAKLAFANLGDYFQMASGEDPYIDLSNVTRDQLAALTEIQVDDYTDGRGEDARDVRRVKIKMADKKAALELLGKHLGMFTDRVEHSGGMTIEVVYVDED